MKELLLSVTEISIATSFVILGLLLFSQLLNRRYVSKWKYFIWIALAIRLVIPVKFPLPKIPKQGLVFEIPAGITVPISTVSTLPSDALPDVTALDVLTAIWLLGCVIFLIVHISSYFHYRRQVLLNGERVKNPEIHQLLQSLSSELKIPGSIPVHRCADASSPMILGFFRPILVLPEMNYQSEALAFILRHELIHLKRHDIFFKFLFITANAIHWFNPLVYLMQKEAVVDMELSCDEAVVEHTGYEGCKAYTETLLATLCRQHCKTTNLSTQFYGGKQVMKKRFKNILHRTAKKNGILLLVLVISLSLILCTVTGCSMAKDENKAQPPEEILMQNEETQPQIQETAAVTEAAPQESGDQSETELKKAAHTAVKFVSACIRSDTSEMRTYLADSFEGVPEAYLFPEVSIGSLVNISATYRAGDISLSRNEAVSIFSETVPIGSTVTLVVPMETNSINFIVGLIRQEEGWKVKDYYIEQASGETALDDNQQIATVAQEFVSAYFSGDRAGLKSHLAQSYNGKYEVYTDYAENSGTTVSDMTLKGFPESREWQLGDKIGSVSLEYRDSAESDSFNYLNMYFIKEETGWKIYFYGIEK